MLSRSALKVFAPSSQLRLDHMPKAFYYNKLQIGNREIVGYGYTASYNYADRPDFPMPGIRFREPTPEINALREKEKGHWSNLTLEEKRTLYRYNYCQTYSEMCSWDGHWKVEMGSAFWVMAIGITLYILFRLNVTPPMPESFSPEARKAQLERIIRLRMNPVQGISSKYDYENNCWK